MQRQRFGNWRNSDQSANRHGRTCRADASDFAAIFNFNSQDPLSGSWHEIYSLSLISTLVVVRLAKRIFRPSRPAAVPWDVDLGAAIDSLIYCMALYRTSLRLCVTCHLCPYPSCPSPSRMTISVRHAGRRVFFFCCCCVPLFRPASC